MQEPRPPAVEDVRLAVRPGRPRARRLLLEQLRQAITTEPAALEDYPGLAVSSLTSIRGRISILIGTIVVRLNREGFAGSERLYVMRDGLASGQPIDRSDLEWIESAIAVEGSEASTYPA